MIAACYLLIHNREALAGAQGVPFISYFPLVVPVVFFVGVLVAAYLRARGEARYAAIGRFVHEDI